MKADAEGAAGGALQEVRLLHLSDTHGLHRTIEAQFPLPPADILLITGDFTNQGLPEEFADFNAWLGELRPRYRHILAILGNHEWMCLADARYAEQAGLFAKALDPAYGQCLLPNARVLEHAAVEVMGLKIYGSAWCPWHEYSAPGDVPARESGFSHARRLWFEANRQFACEHRFGEIPEGMDILLTHGAPFGIFDQLEGTTYHWGGSQALYKEVLRARPRVHLFGHIHEQRGMWRRRADGRGFEGGVEYRRHPGEPWSTFDPPPPDYPCDIIACGAMKNHPGLEGTGSRIAGPGRLLVARRCGSGPWAFYA